MMGTRDRVMSPEEVVKIVQPIMMKHGYGGVRDACKATAEAQDRISFKAGVKEGLVRHEHPLDSPCVFCEYSSTGYWQKGAHSKDCPLLNIGGMEDRQAWLEELLATKEEKP